VPKSSEWSLSFIFSNKNVVCISDVSCVCCMPYPSPPVRWNIKLILITLYFHYYMNWKIIYLQ
jgi:hypothetical protein